LVPLVAQSVKDIVVAVRAELGHTQFVGWRRNLCHGRGDELQRAGQEALSFRRAQLVRHVHRVKVFDKVGPTHVSDADAAFVLPKGRFYVAWQAVAAGFCTSTIVADADIIGLGACCISCRATYGDCTRYEEARGNV